MLTAGIPEHTIAQLKPEVFDTYRSNNDVSRRQRIELSPGQYLELIMKRAGYDEKDIREVANAISEHTATTDKTFWV